MHKTDIGPHAGAFAKAVRAGTTGREWFCTLAPDSGARTTHLLLEAAEFDAPLTGLAALRAMAARCVATCRAYDLRHLAVAAAGEGAELLVRGFVEGALHGDWVDERFVVGEGRGELKLTFCVAAERVAELESLAEACRTTMGSVNLARQMATSPPSLASPGDLTEQMGEFARREGLEMTVLDESSLLRAGHRGVLSAGARETRVAVLKYRPAERRLHPGLGLAAMGRLQAPEAEQPNEYAAAAVAFGAFHGAVKRRLPVRLTLAVGFAQGPMQGQGWIPGEVLVDARGRRVELGAADRAGLLGLADLAAMAAEDGPEVVLAVGGTTPGDGLAYGGHLGAIATRSEALAERLQRAAAEAEEAVGRLPVLTEAQFSTKGERLEWRLPEVKGPGGQLRAAAFLDRFAGPDAEAFGWLDLSGGQGSEGFGVRLLGRSIEALGESERLS
ncbi:MAG: hypothetical protein RLY93_16705 [Sumerlaeia bacterium]